MSDYTVVIPAFNAARTLAAAIESVLSQTVAPAAVIVVDDGSNDSTPDIAEGFGSDVTTIRQPNAGPAAATDRGLKATTTAFVAGLDADDLWLPTKAERQLTLLSERPDLDGVFCRACRFHHGNVPNPMSASQDLWTRSAMMLRTEAIRRIGPVHDPDQPDVHGEMIRWLHRARELGARFGMLDEVLTSRRIIEGSLTYGGSAADYLPLIRQRLQARRRSP